MLRYLQYVPYFVLSFVIHGCLVGCAQSEDGHWKADAQYLADAGFKVKATIIYGTGHVGGQAFNLTGSNGVIEAEMVPKLHPTSAPSAVGPTP